MAIEKIGEVDFLDVKVCVYNDPSQDDPDYAAAWRMRNPDTCYTGIAYLTENGVVYPEGAIIPVQTDKDREMLPQFIVTGQKKLSEDLRTLFDSYLNTEYKIRNGETN